MLVFSLLFTVQFGCLVFAEGITGLSSVWLEEYCMMLGTVLFGLLNV
jgi:hypothetical protein